VVFENPSALPMTEVVEKFGEATKRWRLFPDVLHFRPEDMDLPTCYFTEIGYPANEDDMDLHEVHRIVGTDQPSTDGRSIERFLADLAASGGSAC
jgi:hypothetical protein